MTNQTSLPVRIAMVAHLSEVSGAGVALVETARGLNPDRFEPTLIVPGDGPLLEKATRYGLRTEVIGNPEQSVLNAGWKRKAGLLKQRAGYVSDLLRFFNKAGIELVYVNSTYSIFAGFAAWIARRPIVWHVHETVETPSLVLRLKLGFIREVASGVLYASESAWNAMAPKSGTPAMIVKNHVPVDEIAEMGCHQRSLAMTGGSGAGNRIVVMNGVFPRKGTDLFLRAAAMLVDKYGIPGWKFVIAGDSPAGAENYRNEMIQLAKRLGLDGCVEFKGRQESLLELLAQAAAFVSASRNEALPISLVEAMACGTPIVATAVGDCRQLLGNGSRGVIVAPEDAEALAAGIGEVINHRAVSEDRARKAQDWIRAEYGETGFWKPLEDFLIRIASEDR